VKVKFQPQNVHTNPNTLTITFYHSTRFNLFPLDTVSVSESFQRARLRLTDEKEEDISISVE